MTDGISLTNAAMSFAFAGNDYSVKKANLQQVILFQRKAKEISDSKDAAADLLMGAFAIFLVLNAVDKNVTEEWVKDNCPGDLDVMDVLARLGFMNQQKVVMMNTIRDALVKNEGEKKA